MRRTLPTALAAAVLAAAAVPGISLAAAAPRALEWGPCPADVTPSTGLQCSKLSVPLDHRNPGGQQIEIEISRLASKKPEKRRGVLLTNPGGPSSGLNYPAQLAQFSLPQEVLDSYDVIGFDPRGIGHSTPVTCGLSAEQQKYGNVPPYARDGADVAKHAEEVKEIAEKCTTSKTASMLPYISTANTARDMDRIREVLGESKISYAGSSWGTHLGAVYTTLFPQRSDRFLLDSNLAPGGWDYPSDRLYSQGVEDRFPDFAKYAAANDREYHLGATPEQVTAKYFALAAQLDRKPVEAPDGRYDGTLFRLITFSQLYGGPQLPWLAKAWQALSAGQPPPPLPGETGGVGSPEVAENLVSGRYYIICSDSRWPTSVQTYQRNVAADRIRYPLFGAAGANIQPCAFWPDPIEAPVQIGDRGPSNVLMVQNLRDPATPLAGARKLRQAFGDRARMVTVDAGGHGVYPFTHNECAQYAATTFLTTGERPEQDLACSAAAEPR